MAACASRRCAGWKAIRSCITSFPRCGADCVPGLVRPIFCGRRSPVGRSLERRRFAPWRSSTISAAGEINIAPMGPRVDADMRRFLLRPFNTSQTYHNLRSHGEGVLHVTDDVLLLARAALGKLVVLPPLIPAQAIRGWVLRDA